MGTPFLDIFEYFSVITEDYKLDKIRATDEEIFYKFLKGYMLVGLPEFDCLKSLEYEEQEEIIDSETVTRYYFIETLNSMEIMIISKIMTSAWFKRDIQDAKALDMITNQREFSKGSATSNLKAKMNYLNNLKKDYMSDIYNYYDRNLDKLDFWGDK